MSTASNRVGVLLSHAGRTLLAILVTLAWATLIFFAAVSFRLQAQWQFAEASVNALARGLPWAMALAAGLLVWRKVGYRALLIAAGLSAAPLAFFAWDDTSRPAAPALAGTVADNDPSYAIYRWFLRGDAKSRLPQDEERSLPFLPSDPAEWTALVRKHRTDFEAAWEKNRLGREWIEGMAQHAPGGIYPPPTASGPMLAFSHIRDACHVRWAMAELRWSDGRREQAVEMLTPMLAAAYHLQRGGTSLVHQMIAIVILKATYRQLDHFLESGAVPAETRLRVAGIVRDAPSMKLAIENAFIGEHVVARSAMDEMRDAAGIVKTLETMLGLNALAFESPWGMDWLIARLLFNPNRSERDYAEFLERCCDLAARRKLAAAERAYDDFERQLNQPRIKNPVGRVLMALSLPSFVKVCDEWWRVEDQRLALIEKLNGGGSRDAQTTAAAGFSR